VEWLPGALASIVAVISAFLVWQQSEAARRDKRSLGDITQRLEDRKADREELSGARAFWKESMDEARAQIKSLQDDLEASRQREMGYVKRIRRLETILRVNNIEIPNESM
jgi:septal ring factor EnvC (AmiA/AmiB activator)